MGKWIAVLLGAVAAGAQAESILKCMDAAGRVTWTNRSCQGGETATPVAVVEPSVADSSGLREWAKRNPPPRPARTTAVAQSRKPEKRIDPVDCENARRAHAFEQGWRLRKADQVAYRRKEVCRSCGECP